MLAKGKKQRFEKLPNGKGKQARYGRKISGRPPFPVAKIPNGKRDIPVRSKIFRQRQPFRKKIPTGKRENARVKFRAPDSPSGRKRGRFRAATFRPSKTARLTNISGIVRRNENSSHKG
jgi:hypothetical protein